MLAQGREEPGDHLPDPGRGAQVPDQTHEVRQDHQPPPGPPLPHQPSLCLVPLYLPLCSYLGHLLGHESGGSILSALKASHWANGLSAGTYVSNADFACFSITVELTDEGVEHVDEIVACVFAYIGTSAMFLCISLPCWMQKRYPFESST